MTMTANTLSADEARDGFRLLFDGVTTGGWRGYRRPSIPAGWVVAEGALTRVAPAGDIVTLEQFANFELRLEWRVQAAGNSGIMYRVVETLAESWHTGPEMQVLDDVGHPDGRDRMTAAGSCYALYASPPGVVKPAGEWNAVRIVANRSHVEHWLNGVKVVEYDVGSADWLARVQASKFRAWPEFGRASRGHIALQDHTDHVSYRTIRIKELP